MAAASPAPRQGDRLAFCAFAACALHAIVILGIGFELPLTPFAPSKLEVTLAQYRNGTPEDADFIAQIDQLGSGNLSEAQLMTTTEQAELQALQAQEVNPLEQRRQGAEQPLQPQLVTQSSYLQIRMSEYPQDHDSPGEGERDTPAASEEIATLEAKLAATRQQDARGPKRYRMNSSSTMASVDALYLNNWRSRLEAVGNSHYPDQARTQHLSGELELLVAIRADGTLEEVRLLRSSGYRLFDEAALRTVYLAAPFDPFPVELRQQAEVIEIVRTWHYTPAELSTTR